jgi:hypothetical protein
MEFYVNKHPKHCRFIGVPFSVSFVTRKFMAGRYYYYYYFYYYSYTHFNNLLMPEHEYKGLESNSNLVWENIPSLDTVGNMIPPKSLPMEFPWRVIER